MPIRRSGYIYTIRCSTNGKAYVGSAIMPKARWANHLHLLRRGKHHSPHLQRSFDKYGETSFRFDVVEEVSDLNFLYPREQFWMWRFEGSLFNCAPRAGGPLGVIRPLEFRKRCADRMRGNTIRRGAKMPPGRSEAVSRQMIGNRYRLGVAHRDEDKARISAGLKRAWATVRRPWLTQQEEMPL